jgi:Xaa-Pro aminopeptidase
VVSAATVTRPDRLQRLLTWMEEAGAAVCVLAGAEHVTRFAGYHRYLGGPAAVVIDGDGDRTLLVAHDEAPVAEPLATAEHVVGYGERGFGIDLQPVATLSERIDRLAAVRAARPVAVADDLGGTIAAGLDAPLDAGPALARLRRVPDADELDRLLHAYELSWTAQAAVAEAMAGAASELELFTAAHAAAQLAHGAPIDFYADLVSGADTAKVGAPVHVPGPTRPAAGEPIVADLVIGADGYWGDTAETHLTGGNPEVEAVRTALIEILADCGGALRPGITGAEVFTRMHDQVLERFPGGELPHHAGHGVMLTAFEDPHMVPSDRTSLEPGMVISLEPGVYFAGRFGARVENTFLVTPGGGVELRAAMEAR